MTKKAEVAIALTMVAVGVVYAAMTSLPMLNASTSTSIELQQEQAAQTDALDPEAVNEIVEYFHPDWTLEPERMSADAYPSLDRLIEEDIPDVVIEFDLATGRTSSGLSLMAASEIVKTDAEADTMTIAKALYEGEMRESDGHGYILRKNFPAHFYKSYFVTRPAPSVQ